MRTILIFFLGCLSQITFAQSFSHQNGIKTQVEVINNNSDLLISWEPDSSASAGYYLYRRPYLAAGWGPIYANIPSNQFSFVDTSVSPGNIYEYKLMRNTAILGYGYTCGTIDAPIDHNPGKLLLVIDDFFLPNLNLEIQDMIQDIELDGWFVDTILANRNQAVSYIKNRILGVYNQNPLALKSLFLLGHVPVPYSGDINPDGHPDHLGAWPADAYYGDMNGVWTDNTVNNPSASDPRNQNIVGDGKFDQSIVQSSVELEIGRVDFFNLPAQNQSEFVLLQNYLNKLHAFRACQYIPQETTIIEDNFLGMSEGFAGSANISFSPIVGINNTLDGDYGLALSSDNLWSYGTGPGWYTSSSGIVTSLDFANNAYNTTFTMLFGSYFGDWDSQDNLLRSALSSGKVLASSWSGRPYLFYHPMGIGENLGSCIRASQNNTTAYFSSTLGYFQRWIHIAQMGDPTLRSHYVDPPSNLTCMSQANGEILLQWDPATQAVEGYHVYRHDVGIDNWQKLNSVPINSSSFLDSNLPAGGNYVYMVRSVREQVTGSGRYRNQSIGAMSTCFTDASTENLTSSEMKLYPNPFTENIQLITNQLGRVIITNSIGVCFFDKIVSPSELSINAQTWPAGVYTIQLEGKAYRLVKIN